MTSVALDGEDATGSVGESYFVNVKAMAGAEEVHDPQCLWTLSEVVGPVTSKSATLTCTIGAQTSASMPVVFK